MELPGVLVFVTENLTQSVLNELVNGLFFAHFKIANHGVLDDVDQVQANESVIGISAGTIQIVGVDDGVTAFRSASLVHDFFERSAVPGDGRVEPGISIGFDVDRRTDGQLRFADFVQRALIVMSDVDAFSVTMGISLGRADVNVRAFDFVELVIAHPRSAGAKGGSVSIGQDASIFQ